MLGFIGNPGSLILIVTIGLAAYLYNTSVRRVTWECPIVNTTLGSLQGFTSLSREGREYFEFRGIPYARPPIGQLRFEPPQAAEQWSGVRNVRDYGSDCPQMSLLFGIMEPGSEDCLFLNVNTPARNINDPKNRFPVMVWFYGGMFMEGKSRMYSARYFMDEDVILVTLNYRTGALGFLNTNDALIKGNMGLKDQNTALKWVQQNIKYFGGDENDVTIFGQSAGSASVHYHMLSKLSKGLFQKSISQSGVSTNPWALYTKPREQAFRFGRFFNCPNATTSELVVCLKNVPVQDMLDTYREALSMLRDPITIYVPTIEAVKNSEAFIVEHPAEAIKKGIINKVPWMTGVTSHEGLIISSPIIRNSSLIAGDIDSWKALAAEGLYYKQKNPEATERIKEEYFGSATSIADIGLDVFFQNLTTLFSDRHFFSGFEQAAISHAAHAQVYLYFFNYTTEFSLTNILLSIKEELNVFVEIILNFMTNWFRKNLFGTMPKNYGACHCEEINLLFDVLPPITSVEPHHLDYKMSRALVKLWTSFARMKYPSELEFLGTRWPPINLKTGCEQEISYLHIDTEARMSTKPFADRLKFWESLNL